MKISSRCKNNTACKKHAFTLVELLVVIVIIATLAGLSSYFVILARNKAGKSNCVNNLRQVWTATQQYSDNNFGLLPANGMADDPNTDIDESRGWWACVYPYLYTGQAQPAGDEPIMVDNLLVCPSSDAGQRLKKGEKIAANGQTVGYASWTDGSSNPQAGDRTAPTNKVRCNQLGGTPWLSDSTDASVNIHDSKSFKSFVEPAAKRHDGSIITLYADGSVRDLQNPVFRVIAPAFADQPTED